MRKNAYIRVNVRQIENAFVVDITDENYDLEEYSYPTIEEAITKTKEIFKSDAK